MMSNEKKMISIRLSENIADELKLFINKSGKNQTTIIEEALNNYLGTADEQRIANHILNVLDEKYSVSFDKLKNKLQAIDMNIEMMLQVLNTILYNLDEKNLVKNVVSTENYEHQIMESAKNTVIRKIEKRQQNKAFYKE